MGANRIELTGFTDTMRDRLKAVLARLLERFPVERIAEREAA